MFGYLFGIEDLCENLNGRRALREGFIWNTAEFRASCAPSPDPLPLLRPHAGETPHGAMRAAVSRLKRKARLAARFPTACWLN